MRPATRQLLFGHAVSPPPPPPPPPSIGTPVNLGSATLGSFSGSAAPVITLGAGISVAVGDMILLAASNDSSNVAINSVADNKGNTYLAGASMADGSVWTMKNFFAIATAPLVAGDQITTTFNSQAGAKLVQAFKISGLKSPSSAVHDTGSSPTHATTNSNAPAITTASLAQASEIVFVMVMEDGLNVTLTSGAGFTDMPGAPGLNFNSRLHTAYAIVSATTALSYTGTLSSAANWLALFDAYKGA